MDRRAFVKHCVAAAAGGTVAASGLALARPLGIVRPGGGARVRYFGAHRVGGPAPRGVPLVPLRLGADGALEGVPFVETGRHVDDETGETVVEGIDALAWYRYCGHQNAPGLRHGDAPGGNGLQFFLAADKVEAVNPWYGDLLGKPVRPEDFPDDGFAASFAWRSEGLDGPDVLTGVIVRVRSREVRRLEQGLVNPASPLTEDEFRLVRERFLVHVGDSTFVACSTFCTHFCCVPGYNETQGARTYDAWDRLYCSCHHSVYEPRAVVAYSFFPDPVRDEADDTP